MTSVTRLAMLDVETVVRTGIEAMLRGQGVAVAKAANEVQVMVFRLLPRGVAACVIADVQARREEELWPGFILTSFCPCPSVRQCER